MKYDPYKILPEDKILPLRYLTVTYRETYDQLFPAVGGLREELYGKLHDQQAFYMGDFKNATPTAVQALNLLQELFRVEGGEEKRF